MSKESEQQSAAKKNKSSSAVWGQIGKEAKTPASQVSGLNRSIDSAGDLTGADSADLQQTYGNSFLQRVVQMGGGDSNGGGETESSGVAEQITPVSRDASSAPSGDESEVETRINRSRGQGQSLPDGLRGQMEGSFGADFSGVKVHTDGESDQLNRSLGAQAFTTGSDIYFQQGKYDPGSQGGQKLIAHELTHVVQQGGAARSGIQPKLEVSAPDDKFEKEAEQVADSVMINVSSVGSGDATQVEDAKTTQTPVADDGMTVEAEEAADKAGVSTSQVDSLTERANEKVADGADPKAVAKAAANQITGKGGVGKPSEASGSMLGTESKETGSEAKKAKDNHDPNKIIADKVAPGVKKPVSPEQDAADDLKFDEAEIEEPTEAPLLPNWGELAYGTVQLFAGGEATTEMEWRATQADQSPMALKSGSDTTTQPEAETSSAESVADAEPEPLDRDELIKDALLGGAGEGVVMGATTWFADSMIEAATNNVPYADGWMALGNILMDPDGWAKGVEKTFSADNAAQTFGGWGDISKETTTEGRVAFVLEKILGIIGWVEAINGFFQSMLQIGIAVLYLAWTIANSIPGGQGVAAGIMVVIKFLEMILKWLTFFGNLLLMFKPPLQFTAIGLRIADLKKAEADPQTLLEKQAKLRGATAEFTTGLTQRTLQTGVTKFRESRQAKKKEARRQEIVQMEDGAINAQSGKSKDELIADFDSRYGEGYNESSKSKDGKDDPSKSSVLYGVVFGMGFSAKGVFQKGGDFDSAKESYGMFRGTLATSRNFNNVKKAQSTGDQLDTLKKHKENSDRNEIDVKKRRENLAKEQQDITAKRNGKSEDLTRNEQDLGLLKGSFDAKKADMDLMESQADQKQAAAESKEKLATDEYDQATSDYEATQKALSIKKTDIDIKKQKHAELMKQDQAAAPKGKENLQKVETSAKKIEARLALEADIKRSEGEQTALESQKDVARKKQKAATDAKKAAQAEIQEAKQAKAAIELQKREFQTKSDALTQKITKLESEKKAFEQELRRVDQDTKWQDIREARLKDKQERENRKISELEDDWKDLHEGVVLSSLQNNEDKNKNVANLRELGNKYLPGTGKQGFSDVWHGGDFHSEVKGTAHRAGARPKSSRGLADFGAGGQRHGSGITGGLAGNFMADGVTFGWDWRSQMGLPDIGVNKIEDRVQIAVDLQGAPEGVATAPASFFSLTPNGTPSDNFALSPLDTGDAFPDRLRVILPKNLFANDNLELNAKRVWVQSSGGMKIFTPTVSSVTVVEEEGAVDEGTGDDRVVSGQKIKKYKFSVDYSSQDHPAQNTNDESAEMGSSGLLVQRQAADEEESVEQKQFDQEKDILAQLPEPPDEMIYSIDASSMAYNALVGEEYALQIQQQEVQQFEKENQAQQMEAGAGGLAVETMQQGLDKHEQSTAQSQDAQKEMEAGAKQAQEPAQQGFDLSQEIGKLLQMLIQPLIVGLTTSGQESGSGNQSGGVEGVDKFGGMQGDAMNMATDATAESQATSKQWQAESAVLQGDIRSQKSQYKQMENMMGKQADDVEQSGDNILNAQEANEEEIDEVQSMMDDQVITHEESISEVEDWASEHQEMRLDLYDQLAADLEMKEEKQAEPEIDEAELA
ncbi:MAG: DUF4157 domain-containing protein [Anaerolineae bacterium]